jgi:hypothetical protein
VKIAAEENDQKKKQKIKDKIRGINHRVIDW